MQRVNLNGVLQLNHKLLVAFRQTHGDLATLQFMAEKMGMENLSVRRGVYDLKEFVASFETAAFELVGNQGGLPTRTGTRATLGGGGYSYETAISDLLERMLSPEGEFTRYEPGETAMIAVDRGGGRVNDQLVLIVK